MKEEESGMRGGGEKGRSEGQMQGSEKKEVTGDRGEFDSRGRGEKGTGITKGVKERVWSQTFLENSWRRPKWESLKHLGISR